MSTVLDKIMAYKNDEVKALKASRSVADLEADARAASPVRGFYQALKTKIDAGQYGLIAELKKASPSKGLIREDFTPPDLAKAYEAGGAACLSVLTDGPSFQGSPEYLISARAVTRLPVIRKDFLFDPLQVTQARAMGADAILIIMAAVSLSQAGELEEAAIDWGMDVLVEIHNERELSRALTLQSPLIGINNRNLKTFETDLAITEALAPQIPSGKLVIGESGLSAPEDLARLSKVNVNGFLIGESLMRQDDVEAATRTLLAR